MIWRGVAAASAALLAACSSAPRLPQPELQASVREHLTEARRLAGKDLRRLLILCLPTRAERLPQPVVDIGVPVLIGLKAPDPGYAFDDLLYVGGAWASSWALRTSDGVIVLDALHNGTEAKDRIEGGLAKLGVPEQIRYVVVTHGHGDHYGGAAYLSNKFSASVAMTETDWVMATQAPEFTSTSWDPPPRIDLKVSTGDTLSLGGKKLQFYVTPGHTLGTLSLVFPVTHRGRAHKVLLWGGTAFNFGNDMIRLEAYIKSTEDMALLASQQNVDVLLTNHPLYDETVAKMKILGESATGTNPFVIGNDAVVRALRVMGACARAQRERFSARQ